jgi:uncharacterized protein (DUF952 family)
VRSLSSALVSTIFHVTRAADWLAARERGEYRLSTKGRTLDDEGFVHCCHQDQIDRVATALYGPTDEPLVVLAIASDAVGADVIEENLDGGAELFPHVYGPIPTSAVTSVTPLGRDPSGTFAFGADR